MSVWLGETWWEELGHGGIRTIYEILATDPGAKMYTRL